MKKTYLDKSKIVFFGFVLLLSFVSGSCYGEEELPLPQGGTNLDSAVRLQEASYSEGGGLEEGQTVYYYLEGVQPGQEINIDANVKAASKWDPYVSLVLLNENREQLTAVEEIPSEEGSNWLLSYLVGKGDKDKYYLKVKVDYNAIASYSFDIELKDRYDAGSTTDAGNSLATALNIEEGDYKGYLNGKSENDKTDFYEISLDKNQGLYIKLTPPMEGTPYFKVLDSNRKQVLSKFPSNKGVIMESGLIASQSDDFYIGIFCEECYEGVMEYELNLKKKEGQALVDELGSSEIAGSEIVGAEKKGGQVEEGTSKVEELSKEKDDFLSTVGEIKDTIVSWLIKILIGLAVIVVIIFLVIKYFVGKDKKEEEKKNVQKEKEMKESEPTKEEKEEK